MVTQTESYVKLSMQDIENLPKYKRKTGKEYSAACPFCSAADEDGFLIWPEDGNFWCRQCDTKGFIGDNQYQALSPEKQAELKAERERQERIERERRLSALEKLQKKRPDLIYHHNLNGKTGYVRSKWGLTDDTIETFKVGYCQMCPTYHESDSITIPYYWQGKLVNLRHRLSAPNGSGKYRPEMAGLPSAIFNADLLAEESWIVLVEGEFKAMVLAQYGLPAIAIPGATNFKGKWVSLFNKVDLCHIVLDPGADQHARKIGLMLSKAGVDTRVVTVPAKPDDMFVLYGCNLGQFCAYLEAGRKV